jgi:hypothetical protein
MLDLILISVALFVLEGAFNLFVQKLPAPHFGNLWKIANRWADPGLQAWKPRVSCDRRRSKCAFVCTDAHPFGLSCCLKIWNPQIGFIRSYQIYITWFIMVYPTQRAISDVSHCIPYVGASISMLPKKLPIFLWCIQCILLRETDPQIKLKHWGKAFPAAWWVAISLAPRRDFSGRAGAAGCQLIWGASNDQNGSFLAGDIRGYLWKCMGIGNWGSMRISPMLDTPTCPTKRSILWRFWSCWGIAFTGSGKTLVPRP